MADPSSRAWNLLQDSLKLPTGERGDFLRNACADSVELRTEVEKLLRAVEGVEDVFAAPTLPPSMAEAATAAEPTPPGPQAAVLGGGSVGAAIGPYTLLSVLGEGGFGVVFLAERRKPMVQRVALKVIKPGMDSARVVARFEQERQVLAMMDHPNIARVLDAGATPPPASRPYFVMEYVKGEPITRYCDRQRLSIRQRLELFISVCEAVQHAHNRGVIHRDLKPSNVLVSVVDDKVIPKVIDFGVAKAINHAAAAGEVFTREGVLVGTPEYMSPEQAEMGPSDIDTRTDVFSLGVMLYELLTGSLPLEGETLRRAGLAEIQRLIRETVRPRPSTKLSQLVERESGTADSVAESRHTRIEDLSRELRRELDWIPLKALRTDRTERYRSPIELADDLRNYLAGRAIIARPPSALYTARKFVRRHRAAVVTAGLVLVAIVAGGAIAAWKWRDEVEARRLEVLARTEALRQRDAADSLLEFVNTSVVGAAGGEGTATPIPVPVGTLDRARDDYLSRFAGDPETLRRLGSTFGHAYLAAGQPERVRTLVERLPKGADGTLEPELAGLLGEALFRERAPGSVPLLQRAADDSLSRLGAAAAEDLGLANLRSRLAGALKWNGDFAGARREYQAERSARIAAQPPDVAQIRWIDYNLVLTDIAEARAAAKTQALDEAELQRRLAAARTTMLALRDAARDQLGPEAEQTLACAAEAGDLASLTQQPDVAIAELGEVVKIMDEALGPRHWRSLETKGRLARILLSSKQHDEAARLLEPALRGYRQTKGDGATDTLTIARWLGMALERSGRADEAISVLEDAAARGERASAAPSDLARVAQQLSTSLAAQGNAPGAETWKRRAETWQTPRTPSSKN
jgi:serine/threonine protein kinase/tetratricopeptide (TPR) repeat protein